MKRVKNYYPKRFWYRKPKRSRLIPMSPSQAGTKGGEPFDNTTEKPAQQEGSETVNQAKTETTSPNWNQPFTPSWNRKSRVPSSKP